jgi:gluconolactonase
MSEDFEIIDPAFEALLAPDSRLEKLTSPAVWAEGPVWLPERDAVIFSDVKGNRMFVWSERTGTSVFRQPSNYNNGNALDRKGRLISCEHGRRCVSRTEKDGTVTVLAEKYDGRRFNSPNDVVVKSDGSIWFTDPPYGIIGDEEGYKSESQIVGCWVYRLDPDTGDVSIATVDVERPNGLAFSPDESLLYVADMSLVEFPKKGRRQLSVYGVVDGKRLAGGRKLIDIEPGIPDGFRVDREGRVFTSSEDSIQVVSPDGRLLGKIRVPERISNCTFGGRNEDALYITATTSLYRIRLATRGVQYSHLL